jgi:glycosyltransferase involved in cell wall biosynthesis
MDEDDRCDLSFAATNVYPKDHYPEVLLGRVEMARLVASLGELHLYGEWGHRRFDWGGECRDDELHRCFWGHRSYEQMASAFASSRVTLNSHVRPDGYRYLNERVTTGMASGTAMLCDRVNGIEELFTDMKEIALWSSAEELVEKAQWLLAHETERAAMAEAGRAVVLERYSNVRLAEDILSEAALVKGVRQ